MSDAASTGGVEPRSLPAKLGWGHRGFVVASRPRAIVALVLLLTPAAFLDFRRVALYGIDAYADLATYYRMAQDFARNPDASIYTQHPAYLYPPFFAVLASPLAWLSPTAAALVFQACKWFALIVALQLCWRICSSQREDLPPVVALGSLMLAARFFQADFAYGNINTFLLCATLASLWLLQQRRAFIAGVLLGLVTSIKIMPAMLIVYFAYKRWWIATAGAVVGLILALLVIPALALGWNGNLAALSAWHEHLVADFVVKGEVNSAITNQSLTAVMNRVLGPSIGIKPDTHVAIVVLPVQARNAIRATVVVAIVAALAYACRRPIDPQRQPIQLACEVSLVLVAMLILSGFSWKGTFVSLLLPFTALLACASDARCPPSARVAAGWFLSVAVGLCVLATDIITPRGLAYVEAFGGILLIAVVVGAGAWCVHSQLRSVRAGA